MESGSRTEYMEEFPGQESNPTATFPYSMMSCEERDKFPRGAQTAFGERQGEGGYGMCVSVDGLRPTISEIVTSR
jgi:hypothetical protein